MTQKRIATSTEKAISEINRSMRALRRDHAVKTAEIIRQIRIEKRKEFDEILKEKIDKISKKYDLKREQIIKIGQYEREDCEFLLEKISESEYETENIGQFE